MCIFYHLSRTTDTFIAAEGNVKRLIRLSTGTCAAHDAPTDKNDLCDGQLVSGGQLVSWCFEPSQPQRITSGLKTNFSLSPAYSSHESWYTPQISFSQTTTKTITTISERKPRKTIAHVLQPIHIPRALNTGTCIQQGDQFYSAGLHRNPYVSHSQHRKTTERFWKKCRRMDQKGRISREEILRNNRSMLGYMVTYP